MAVKKKTAQVRAVNIEKERKGREVMARHENVGEQRKIIGRSRVDRWTTQKKNGSSGLSRDSCTRRKIGQDS